MENNHSFKNRGILLVNLGSPDSTEVKDVRRYLAQFLMDSRVIDAPYLIRKMIVGLFILPFRPKESAHAYKQIWWKKGSPLIVISKNVQKKLQACLELPLEMAMRYGNPSIESGIQRLLAKKDQLQEIFLVPLYPHYAMATFETVVVEVERVLKKLKTDIQLTIQPPFYEEPAYIKALAESAQAYLEKEYDHLLFSYHGIPERHCKKTDPTGVHCLKVENCCKTPSQAHATCYRHQVYRTTEAFVKYAGIPDEKYSVAFQSKLGVDSWLKPAADEEIIRLAKAGIKRLQVICPAFVSDCIETLEEIGIRARESFLEAGGETLELIPCLNDHETWIEALNQWCLSGAHSFEMLKK